eukprot:5555108-Amphidinium_carterae.1
MLIMTPVDRVYKGHGTSVPPRACEETPGSYWHEEFECLQLGPCHAPRYSIEMVSTSVCVGKRRRTEVLCEALRDGEADFSSALGSSCFPLQCAKQVQCEEHLKCQVTPSQDWIHGVKRRQFASDPEARQSVVAVHQWCFVSVMHPLNSIVRCEATGVPGVYTACEKSSMPFPVQVASIVAPNVRNLFYSFEFTPLYAGVPAYIDDGEN